MRVKPTNEQLLADIRKRLAQGYTEATAERVVSIAARESDPDILRQLIHALAEALTNPPKRKVGRPTKGLIRRPDGVFDLDASAPETKSQQLRTIKEIWRDEQICQEIAPKKGTGKLASKKGTFAKIELAANKHNVSIGAAKATYYAWRKRRSK